MKSKSFMLMILSMAFGLIAAIGISQVMGRNNGPAVEAPKMGPVLVAADFLEHNAFLTEENVRIENWPIEIIPENAATTLEQIADMATRSALSKGLPIIVDHLVHQKNVNDINIPKGFKVVAIKVAEDDTMAGLLNPGDKVDVIGLFKTRTRDGQSQTFSKTFLKALRVFSVNASMRAGTGNREENTRRGSAIVGVLVTEKQAEAIVYVQKTGTLKLVLRGDHIDDEIENQDDPLANLGFPNQMESPEEPDDEKTGRFGGFNTSNDGSTMVIWNGSEPQKVVFEDGSLPQSSYDSSSRDEDRARDNDEEDPDSFDESERGLEEDQYRGE